MKISVVIQTYNSEQFLERVLNSVKEFDEIVVCDMYSTDRTIEIARKFDCKIVYHKKTDFCEPARNFAIHSATYGLGVGGRFGSNCSCGLEGLFIYSPSGTACYRWSLDPTEELFDGKIHTWGLSGLYLTFFP